MADEQAAAPEIPARERQYAKPTRGQRRRVTGTVVSTKMAKTIAVQIERMERHAKYGKYIRRHSKVYAHDEKGEAKLGDMVEVVESRPMSKLKRFHLAQVLKRATSGEEVSA